jgi:ketosteroid isomerase-like protein
MQDLLAVDHAEQYADAKRGSPFMHCRARYCVTMARSNIEIVRAGWANFAGLDGTSVDWGAEPIREMLLAPFAEDVVLNWSANWAGERHYRGKDGVVQAFQEWIEPFSEYHAEPLDFIDAGDRVLVPNRQWASGRPAAPRSRSR